MADNTTLNAGSGGDDIATDDIGGIKHQRVKVQYGDDGSATDVSDTNPLPIDDAGGSLTVDGTVTAELSATDNAVLDSIAALLTTIDADTGASATDLAAIEALITAGNVDLDAIETLLTAANVDHAAIEALLTTIDADTGSVATDAGTIAGAVKAEDAAHTTSDTGIPALVVRQDSAASLAGTDGDYTMLQTDANGALRVTGGGGGTEYTVNAAAPTDPTGTASLMERDDALSSLTEVEGDWTNMRANANGALWVKHDGEITAALSATDNAVLDSIDSGLTNTISTNNSSSSTLTSAATFTGTGEDVSEYSAVTVLVYADVASATDGFSVQFSSDNTNWDEQDDFTVGAGQTERLTVPVNARYFRVVYTNGGTGQSAFRLQSILHRFYPGQPIRRLSDDEPPDLGVQTVKAAIVAQASGSGNFVPVAANASGKLQVAAEIEDGGNSITVDGTVAATQSGTWNVGTVTPGTAATNLGKAEDAAHTTGDVGVMPLAVRNDTASALAGTNGDYIPITTDSAGRVHVAGPVTQSGTWNVGTVTTTTTLTGSSIAHDGADSGNPHKIGAKAGTADQTAVANADRTDLRADTLGHQVVRPYALHENLVQGVTAAITDTSNTSVIAAAGAGVRNYITSITVTNSHATVATVVEIKDGTTVIHRGYAAAAGGGYTVNFPTPLRGSANTAVNAANVTTGSNTYVSASGYKAAV